MLAEFIGFVLPIELHAVRYPCGAAGRTSVQHPFSPRIGRSEALDRGYDPRIDPPPALLEICLGRSDAHPDSVLYLVGLLHQQGIDHSKLRRPELRAIAPEVLKQCVSVLHERHEQSILNLVVLCRVHDAVAEVDQRLQVALRRAGSNEDLNSGECVPQADGAQVRRWRPGLDAEQSQE